MKTRSGQASRYINRFGVPCQTRTSRITEPLAEEYRRLAAEKGMPVNALMVIALTEYIEAHS